MAAESGGCPWTGNRVGSSERVVEVGRSVAERIPVGNRLPKAMLRAGHQSWRRGDMIARDFVDEHEEAAWICDRIQAMRGLAFNDSVDIEPRGPSWSDFAVSYRSVANDAGPLVEEMRRREIPYVVKGLNRLFDSPEIQAVVGLFRYMAGLVHATDLRRLWDKTRLVSEGISGLMRVTWLEEWPSCRDASSLPACSEINVATVLRKVWGVTQSKAVSFRIARQRSLLTTWCHVKFLLNTASSALGSDSRGAAPAS